MEEKVIFWGAYGEKARRVLENFEGIFDYIEVFIDINSKESSLNGIKVEKPNRDIIKNDRIVVIATQRFFEEIYNELRYKYNVGMENIVSLHEWICLLLSKRKIKLRPISVRLETCTLCQLDCLYCYMRTGNYGQTGKGYLSFEAFKKFVDSNDFIKHIEISNSGEVFLNKDLTQILEYAFEKQIDITICNGTNFNDVSDEMLELLVKKQVKFINISLDGASQEIYSIYRRKGNFDKVISNIKKLNEYKVKYNSVYPELQWQYILMEHNMLDVEKADRMAKELNMKICYTYDAVKNDFQIPNREAVMKVTGLKYLTQKEYNDAHENVIYGQDYCYQMLFSPQINYDGRLLGCCIVWNQDYGVNVFEEGLISCLNSEKYLSAVEMLLGIKQNYDKNIDIPCFGECDMGIVKRIKRKDYMYI